MQPQLGAKNDFKIEILTFWKNRARRLRQDRPNQKGKREKIYTKILQQLKPQETLPCIAVKIVTGLTGK